MIDVDLLTKVSDKVFSEHLTIFVWAAKALGATLFLFVSGKHVMKFFIQGKNMDGEAIGTHEILRLLATLALIVAIPDLLNLADKLFSGLLDLFMGDFKGDELSAMQFADLPVSEVTQEDSSTNAILKTLLNIKDMFSVNFGLTRILTYFAYGLDILVFMMFLGKRFFILGVLKIISPLLIAFSMIPEYKAISYNLGKVYTRTFLSIIPMLLVVVFANEFYSMFNEYMIGDTSRTGIMVAASDVVRAMAILGMVWLKFKLFRTSSDIMKSVWS